MATNNYIEYVERFNHNIKILTRDLSKRCAADATIFRAQKRIMTVIAIEPIFVIKNVGPYLYSYREQIYNLNSCENDSENFFLENAFDTELKEGVNQEKVDMVSYIIPRAKECARTLPPAEKAEYKALVIALLDDYIEYLSIINHC